MLNTTIVRSLLLNLNNVFINTQGLTMSSFSTNVFPKTLYDNPTPIAKLCL